MNSAQHFARAQALLAEVAGPEETIAEWVARRTANAAAATAHAQLAVVALDFEGRAFSSSQLDERDQAWTEALGGS